MGVAGRACKAHAGGAPPCLAAAATAAELGRMQTRAERIRDALQAAFPPAEVRVQDDSHRHAGHAGARPEGETHYSVRVVSPAFAGMGRVARSRAAHAALEREFGTGLHALALRLLTPEEAARG
jgi:BolA family transcriptional regulator, general stress-responsive regulator